MVVHLRYVCVTCYRRSNDSTLTSSTPSVDLQHRRHKFTSLLVFCCRSGTSFYFFPFAAPFLLFFLFFPPVGFFGAAAFAFTFVFPFAIPFAFPFAIPFAFPFAIPFAFPVPFPLPFLAFPFFPAPFAETTFFWTSVSGIWDSTRSMSAVCPPSSSTSSSWDLLSGINGRNGSDSPVWYRYIGTSDIIAFLWV